MVGIDVYAPDGVESVPFQVTDEVGVAAGTRRLEGEVAVLVDNAPIRSLDGACVQRQHHLGLSGLGCALGHGSGGPVAEGIGKKGHRRVLADLDRRRSHGYAHCPLSTERDEDVVLKEGGCWDCEIPSQHPAPTL